MRFSDTLDVTFQTKNILENTEIAPMLILPFIENSFKHGQIVNGKLVITIALSCTTDAIYFSIENTSKKVSSSKRGIGLENLQKRLDLLYKNKYELVIDDSKNRFKVDLILSHTN
jgi:hypothetical protein